MLRKEYADNLAKGYRSDTHLGTVRDDTGLISVRLREGSYMETVSEILAMSGKQFGSNWAPRRLLEDYGAVGLTKMSDSAEFDFRHEVSGARIELKAARTQGGVFRFQYIRPNSSDVCICLCWESGKHHYWLIPSAELGPLLSRQYRRSEAFQLRAGRESLSILAKYEVVPTALRQHLENTIKKSLRHRRAVRLDPALGQVDGWPAVAASIDRRLRDCGLSDWSFLLILFSGPTDPDEPGLVPYPAFNYNERRIEVFVPPEPVIGRRDVAVTASCYFDLFDQYLEREEGIDDFDEDIDETEP